MAWHRFLFYSASLKSKAVPSHRLKAHGTPIRTPRLGNAIEPKTALGAFRDTAGSLPRFRRRSCEAEPRETEGYGAEPRNEICGILSTVPVGRMHCRGRFSDNQPDLRGEKVHVSVESVFSIRSDRPGWLAALGGGG